MHINLKEVRASGNKPRVHGNGFLQLDLTERSRLHIWGHPDLPRQKTETAIHNHRFDFSSTCVAGRVFNVMYSTAVNPRANEPTHVAYEPHVRDGEDTVLVPANNGAGVLIYVNPDPVVQMRPVGMQYTMSGPIFHETFSDRPSATIMTKLPRPELPPPWVLVPLSFKPDNDFNRNAFDEEHLWEIIHEVLGY